MFRKIQCEAHDCILWSPCNKGLLYNNNKLFYFLTVFCRDINPDVEFEAYNYNITLLENFKHFLCRIR